MDTGDRGGSGQAEQFAWPFFSEEDVARPAAVEPPQVATPEETRSRVQVVAPLVQEVPAADLPETLAPASSLDDSPGSTAPASGWITVFIDGQTPFEWHDAVALVQQLAEQYLASGRNGGIPHTDEIVLEADGHLRMTPDPAATESAVRGLGHLLSQLLSGRPAPAALRLIGSQAVAHPVTIESVSDFMQRLAPFERPNRLGKLAGLHARASAAGVWTEAAPKRKVPAPPAEPKETPRLTIAEVPPAVSPVMILFQRIIQDRSLALSAIAIVVGVAVVLAAWAILGGEESADRPAPAALQSVPLTIEPPALEPTATRTEATTPGGSRAAIAPAVKPTATARNSAAPAANRRLAPGTDSAANAGARPAPTAQAGRPGLPPAAQLSRGLSAPPASAADSRPIAGGTLTGPLAAGTLDNRIYSADDPSVVEPVLLRPYFPQPLTAGPPDSGQGVLDLIIDKDGTVEFVRLTSPGNRYRERWWVSVAKNWQFRPAFKDGQPVRFRKQIPITDFPESLK